MSTRSLARASFAGLVTALALVVSGSSMAGCGSDGSAAPADTAALDQALVDDTADTATASSQSSGLARQVFVALDARKVGSLDPSGDASKQIQAVQENVLASYDPPGCAKLTVVSAGHVKLLFDDCSVAGLAHLSGELDVAFSGVPGRLHVDLAAPAGLTANGASVEYAANADVVTSDGAQTIAWRTTTWRAATAKGHVVSHAADYTIDLDLSTRCSVLSGSTSGQVEATTEGGITESRGLDTVIDDFSVCPASCPTTGTIRSTGERTHHTVVLRFDGGDSAHVTGVHGATFDLPLACSK